jgi:hypothetical protein
LVTLPLLADILIIRNVVSISIPANVINFCFFCRVDKRLHSMVISGLRFHKINNVEAVEFVFASVLYFEEVPLGETVCAVVILQEQVILSV